MKNISLAFITVLAFAAPGCKKKGADCDKAINNSMELSKADMAKMPGMDDKMMAKMKDVGIQHCKDDKWPDDAVKCMSDAKSETDAQACYGKLSKDQRQNMNKAAMEMAKPTEGAPPTGDMNTAPPPTGTAPAGSDTAPAGTAPAGTAPEAPGSAAAAPAAGSAAAPK